MICQEATHRGLLADFVWTMVYIAEAHALSEWPIRSARFSATGSPILVPEQPQTVLERCTLARRFCHEYNIPTDFCNVLVDNPEHDDPFGGPCGCTLSAVTARSSGSLSPKIVPTTRP
jgi:hypothetical protein